MDVYIYDLDGCLCDDMWRQPYICKMDGNLLDKPDWTSYFEGLVLDEPVWQIRDMAMRVEKAGGVNRIITSRPEEHRDATKLWLGKNGLDRVFDMNILMRCPDIDGYERSPRDTKARLLPLASLGSDERVVLALDDNDDNTRMYAEHGIPALTTPVSRKRWMNTVFTVDQTSFVRERPYPTEAFSRYVLDTQTTGMDYSRNSG